MFYSTFASAAYIQVHFQLDYLMEANNMNPDQMDLGPNEANNMDPDQTAPEGAIKGT